MHITSARFVKFKLSPSYYALFAKGATLWCLLFFVTISNIPLIATLYIFALLFWLLRDNNVGWSVAVGILELNDNHELLINGERRLVQSSDTVWHSLFVVLKFKQGEPLMIWRDSCRDEDYRQLLVWLKNKKGAQCSL
ncbi:protein YgfX [Vibrio sp. D449a]|uniref:protein YgfX n=1 Tax=Vibrio sp. D449a TaxID=2837389 RepID=UPI00358EAD24